MVRNFTKPGEGFYFTVFFFFFLRGQGKKREEGKEEREEWGENDGGIGSGAK